MEGKPGSEPNIETWYKIFIDSKGDAMTYRREISFPINPTKDDLKKLKRQVAKDKFKVIDGKTKKKGKQTER